MILPNGVIQSINKNKIEIGNGWLYSSIPVWDPAYSKELSQPVSVSASDLYDLHFIGAKTTIAIRSAPNESAAVLWGGIATLVADPTAGNGTQDPPEHNTLPGRAASGAHPISAIDGLADAVAGLHGEINSLKAKYNAHTHIDAPWIGLTDNPEA